jgi:hypothetical protein
MLGGLHQPAHVEIAHGFDNNDPAFRAKSIPADFAASRVRGCSGSTIGYFCPSAAIKAAIFASVVGSSVFSAR